jgi:antitoxin ParD1/3/4
MPTRNVVLTEHQESLIDSLVRSGRYQNANEVVQEALRLVEDGEVAEAAKLEVLRTAAALGVAALDRGAYTEFGGASALIDYLNHLADEVASGTSSIA